MPWSKTVSPRDDSLDHLIADIVAKKTEAIRKALDIHGISDNEFRAVAVVIYPEREEYRHNGRLFLTIKAPVVTEDSVAVHYIIREPDA